MYFILYWFRSEPPGYLGLTVLEAYRNFKQSVDSYNNTPSHIQLRFSD